MEISSGFNFFFTILLIPNRYQMRKNFIERLQFLYYFVSLKSLILLQLLVILLLKIIHFHRNFQSSESVTVLMVYTPNHTQIPRTNTRSEKVG